MMSNDINKLKQEVADIVRKNFDRDVEVIILKFENNQDEKNRTRFASKKFEELMVKIINGTTWALISAVVFFVISAIINFLKNNVGF